MMEARPALKLQCWSVLCLKIDANFGLLALPSSLATLQVFHYDTLDEFIGRLEHKFLGITSKTCIIFHHFSISSFRFVSFLRLHQLRRRNESKQHENELTLPIFGFIYWSWWWLNVYQLRNSKNETQDVEPQRRRNLERFPHSSRFSV